MPTAVVAGVLGVRRPHTGCGRGRGRAV